MHTNKNRANVYKVYSISELADLFGLTYNEVDVLISKELLTTIYIEQAEQWAMKKARARYYLPLTPQNKAVFEQQAMLKRCYRYTKAVEALVLDQIDGGEETLNTLKEKNEVNGAGDLFGIYGHG